MKKLLELMKSYEDKQIGDFHLLHCILFTDGSGQLIYGDMANPDEELLEFDKLDELYEFLSKNEDQ